MAKGVSDRDRGYRDLLKRLLKKGRPNVTVGLHEAEGSEAHEGEGLTVLDVGTIHEFGAEWNDANGNPRSIPRRSFIADWADENQERHRSELTKLAEAVVQGKLESTEQALDRFGLKAAGEVQHRIKAGIEPPLADSTVEAKGSSTPLVDTGQLWTSIRHKVDRE